MYRTFKFSSPDGTALEGWTNDGKGPTIVVCNGLGVPPEAWPRLLDPECGYRVFSWNQRGTFGSQRPEDLEKIRIGDHVADAFALMEEVGVDKAILVAWSYGVNISFEVAKQQPERIAGLVMCAGVPGGTLDSAFAPLLVPRAVRKPLSLAVANAGKLLGPQLNTLAKLLPKNNVTADIMRHTGLIMPTAKTEDIVPWLESFATHDFSWYFNMFPAAGEHERMDPSFIEVPIAVAAGALDTLTSALDIVEFAEQIPHAEIHVLQGTHFIPLEFPDDVMNMIDSVVSKSELADQMIKTHPADVTSIHINETEVDIHHSNPLRQSS